MTTVNLVELMPFYAFLVKNTIYPAHDCFTCFNKDPERRYSIYQYTNDEWKQELFKQKPEELRKSEARALTQIFEQEESFHNLPTELRSSTQSPIEQKRERLIGVMASDHKIMDKFHQVFSEQDVLRLGGEMSNSLLEQNQTMEKRTDLAFSEEEEDCEDWATPGSVLDQSVESSRVTGHL